MAFGTRYFVTNSLIIIFYILIHQSKSHLRRKFTLELEDIQNGAQPDSKIYIFDKAGSGTFGTVDRGILYKRTEDGKYAIEDIAVKEQLSDEHHNTQEYDTLIALKRKLQNSKEKKAQKEKKNKSKTDKVKDKEVEFGGVGRLYGMVYSPKRDASGIVMQLLGETLDEDTFAAFGTKNPTWFWEYIAPQMIACVLELHSVDLLHRDIKPENFMFGAGVNRHLVYIADLGFSKYVNSRWSFRHKGESIGTPPFISPYVQMENKYRFKDDYCSLIFSFIYLLSNKTLPWDKLYTLPQINAKNEYDCKGIPGGTALNNFLKWARSYKTPYRVKNPKPKRILAFIKAIQMEVANTPSGISDNQNFKPKSCGCLFINSAYEPQIHTRVEFDPSNPVLYMRFERIAARIAPDPPASFLDIEFVIDSPPMQVFVSLHPGIHDHITKCSQWGHKVTFFVDKQDMVNFASKFDGFIEYGISVITTETLLQVARSNDTIVEDVQSHVVFKSDHQVERIEAVDLEQAVAVDNIDEYIFFKKLIDQIVAAHKGKTTILAPQ